MEIVTAHQTINDVLSIRVMTRISSLTTYKVHYFVLAFAGYASIGNNDLNLRTLLVIGQDATPKLTLFHPESVFILCTVQ